MENNELSFEKITGRISEIVVLLDDPKNLQAHYLVVSQVPDTQIAYSVYSE